MIDVLRLFSQVAYCTLTFYEKLYIYTKNYYMWSLLKGSFGGMFWEFQWYHPPPPTPLQEPSRPLTPDRLG